MKAPFAIVILATLLITGCSSVIDEGPTNDEIKNSTGLTVDEAARIVYENLNTVWPNQTNPDPHDIEKSGCRTNPNSLRSEGPPWRVARKVVKPDPAPELIDQVLAKLDTLTSRGFTLAPRHVTNDHPADRVYRDDRGYVVQSEMDIDSRVPGPPRFSVRSSSPCAAE
ncbi:hypothetical protein IU459_02480 [Nocardia amamiensis]|uniref:Lipoprotein n=1 Tax=Nocardia amamiensis TaxID=404578 RepID=A0ABS0CIG6_9NOCA|nr:hypothetical protein [Nocardia amamiensis]MBF6296406.1 hypothetical protein [Nocardia amamiensis]